MYPHVCSSWCSALKCVLSPVEVEDINRARLCPEAVGIYLASRLSQSLRFITKSNHTYPQVIIAPHLRAHRMASRGGNCDLSFAFCSKPTSGMSSITAVPSIEQNMPACVWRGVVTNKFTDTIV